MNVPQTLRQEFEIERENVKSKITIDSVAVSQIALRKMATYEQKLEAFELLAVELQNTIERFDKLSLSHAELLAENGGLKARIENLESRMDKARDAVAELKKTA